MRARAWVGIVVAALALAACSSPPSAGGASPSPSGTVAGATATPTPSALASASPTAAGTLSANEAAGLGSALDAEYHSYALYDAMVAKFGAVAPFSNILAAEGNHVEAIKTLYERYGIPVPANPWTGTATAPSTTAEACSMGVSNEQSVIAMYDQLSSTTTRSDILAVYANLQAVSRDNHLPAFQRC